jgi:membrane protein
MKRFVAIGLLLKEAACGWSEHRAFKMGAALAFYTTLALAPLTIIAIAIAGYFFGEEAARGGIVDQIEKLVGLDGAIMIETLIKNASEPRHGHDCQHRTVFVRSNRRVC